MPTDKKKFLHLSLGAAISLICLWLALRTVPFNELGQALSEANYLWLIPTLLLTFIGTVVRAVRWRVLLRKRVSLAESFWAYSVGFIFTNIFPFRLGEPARIAVLATHRKLSLVEIAATVGVERLLDVIAVVMILLGVLPFMNIVPTEVKEAGLLFGGAAILGLIVIFTLVKLEDRSEALLHRLVSFFVPKYANSVVTRWGELTQGLGVLTQRSIATSAVGWSIAAWVASIGVQWSVLRAFQPAASLVEASFMLSALALAIAVPAGPGFIGVYQWVGQQSLVIPFPELYTTSSALGVAITAHLAYYLITSGLGVIGMWYFGQTFVSLNYALNKSTEPTEAIHEA